MIARVAVSAKGLVKRYGKRRALDGFTLDVPVGCVMGLVGPNGAGKTTWMMSVAGLLRAESGTIGLFGTSQSFDAALHSGRLAILPQDSELPLESTPESFLAGLARLQGLSKDAAKESVAKILEAVNLADRARTSIRSLSHGMRKRLMAAQCFLGSPELILLDEPMNGLDPEEAARFRNLILSRAESCTVVVSSHNLADLERLCTHVTFVRDGKVVKTAALKDLTADGASLEDVYLGGVAKNGEALTPRATCFASSAPPRAIP
ncbi:MAG: ABC transporter ATP-binding protein [Kiritimatiellae bacterium]|nr:ABC transporter ATP-binding protein [Kiritimatiellia bacterium]